MKRRIAYLIVLAAVTAVAAATAFVHAPSTARAGGDNVVVAINTKDGKSVFRVRMSVARANGDVVSNTNAAIAYASCSSCQTTAIAFQVVLITNDASVITPMNLALAFNEGCSGCETVAQAYQFVQQTDGQVHFTHEGSKTLAHVRHDLKKLKHADLSIPELQAELDALAAEVAGVLAHEVVPAGSS